MYSKQTILDQLSEEVNYFEVFLTFKVFNFNLSMLIFDR